MENLLICLFAVLLLFANCISAGVIEDMPPGTWYEVPDSKLETVFPSPFPPGHGPENVIRAWSGGAYDTKRDRLLISGGGHADYAGNEIYAFDINTLQWSRIWGPTPNSQIHDGSSCQRTYADGNPCSRHTYDSVTYLPEPVDAMLIAGGSFWCNSGGGSNDVWLFKFSTNTWEEQSDSQSRIDVSLTTAYDPTSGHIFLRNTGGIGEWNPSADSWTLRSSRQYWGDAYNLRSEVDPIKNIVVYIGLEYNSGAKLGVLNLGNYAFSTPSYSGNTEILDANAPGMAYDPITKKMIAWNGGADVYSIDTTTWAITKMPPAESNTVIPTASARRGTYGRWQYIPSKNVFVGVSATNENVYIYRHNSGTGTPDTTSPTQVTGITATPISTSQIDLSWTASTDNVGVTGYEIYMCQGTTCTPTTSIGTPSTNSFSSTGLSSETAYRYRVRAYDAAGNFGSYSSIVSATTFFVEQTSRPKLLDFDTGGPLTCTGTSPNIICTDSDKMEAWSYYHGSTKAGFRNDLNSDFLIAWGDYAGDKGWFEVDNTKGAEGTSGSLFVRATGGATTGGDIYRKSDELNYPDRISSEIEGLPYLDFLTNGWHRNEFKGKDRFYMYIWIPENWMLYHSYGNWNDYNLHVGTYACPESDQPCRRDIPRCDPYSQGEPCDGTYGHWYHYYTFGQWGGGGWVKIMVDQNPQWCRYSPCSTAYNPTQDPLHFGENYLETLNRFYLMFTGRGSLAVPCPIEIWIDEITSESKSVDYAETNQNEIEIASVALGYYPEGVGHWEISWSSETTTRGTYEVKYSLEEFTNKNYDRNGAHIVPLTNGAVGGDGLVGKLRSNTDYGRYATYFSLPNEYNTPGTIVYFAIKDVSKTGQHGTSELEWATDQRTSSDSRIYSISYTVSGAPAHDKNPPVRNNPQPTENLIAGTTQTTISLTTNEPAACRYSATAGSSYSSMINAFAATGTTSHSQEITGLENGAAYTYYVRCMDSAGNANTDDFIISFGVSNANKCSNADTNLDNIVSMAELVAHIAKWKIGTVTMSELMAAVREWKQGC